MAKKNARRWRRKILYCTSKFDGFFYARNHPWHTSMHEFCIPIDHLGTGIPRQQSSRRGRFKEARQQSSRHGYIKETRHQSSRHGCIKETRHQSFRHECVKETRHQSSRHNCIKELRHHLGMDASGGLKVKETRRTGGQKDRWSEGQVVRRTGGQKSLINASDSSLLQFSHHPYSLCIRTSHFPCIQASLFPHPPSPVHWATHIYIDRPTSLYATGAWPTFPPSAWDAHLLASPLEIGALHLIAWDAGETSVSALNTIPYPYSSLVCAMNVHRSLIFRRTRLLEYVLNLWNARRVKSLWKVRPLDHILRWAAVYLGCFLFLDNKLHIPLLMYHLTWQH